MWGPNESWDNDPFSHEEQSGKHEYYEDYEEHEYYIKVGHSAEVVKLAEIDNQNRIVELSVDIEEAMVRDADPDTFKKLRFDAILVGKYLVDDFENRKISEDIMLSKGKLIERCKKLCEKNAIQGVNF